jgi:hypothetical protein
MHSRSGSWPPGRWGLQPWLSQFVSCTPGFCFQLCRSSW